MAVFDSQLDTNSPTYKANAEVMAEAVAEFRGVEQNVLDRANGKAPAYEKRGYMAPRDRLIQLLDAGSPWLELSSLCGFMQDQDKDGSFAGGSVIAGIGYIEGTRCAVMLDDFLTKGGIITRLGGVKRVRMQLIAMKEKMPLVSLAQSGGGNLTTAGETFGPSGEIFANQCRLSAAGIPQITVVHGSATAGGAYQPGLSDYIVMIRKQSTVYLAGPPLLKAATGEIATDEAIGGAEMHAEIAGTADYLAENGDVTGDFQDRLKRAEIDFAVSAVSDTDRDVHAEPLRVIKGMCYMRKGHPLEDKKISLKQFLAYPHVRLYLPGPSRENMSLVDEVLGERGMHRRVVLETTQFAPAIGVLARTDCLLIDNASFSGKGGLPKEVIVKPLPEELERLFEGHSGGTRVRAALLRHTRTSNSAAHQWMRKLIVKHLSEPETG